MKSLIGFLCIFAGSGFIAAQAADADLENAIRKVHQQNQELERQLEQQKKLIEQLQSGMKELQGTRETAPPATPATDTTVEDLMKLPFRSMLRAPGSKAGKVILGGQGGLALFSQGTEGRFSHSDFRVDDSFLFLNAQVLEDVYFFSEVNLLLRPQPDFDYLWLGELYVDFENISGRWGKERWLNARVGRLDIPFGEEYRTRDVVDNPLISHSLSDIWGIDEGVQIYGTIGKFDYALAVQNGGHPMLNDHDGDKAVVGRLSYDPFSWLHFSGSAMRTGDLAVKGDELSEVWFGNGFFRALGSKATTTKFHANLFEGDVRIQFPRGHLKGAGGHVRFDDNDLASDNHRQIYYYYAEGVHELTDKLYAAGRFSQILTDQGYPIVGGGVFADRFLGVSTKDIWRMSLGLGYRWTDDLVLKLEYTIDRGELVDGRKRNKEDLLAFELGYRF